MRDTSKACWTRRPRWAALVVLTAVAVLAGTGPSSGLSLTFLCFFDRGSAQVTDRCRRVVGEAARYWRRVREEEAADPGRLANHSFPDRAGQVEVRAYAPDGGSPEASRRLSLARALAVAAELRAASVPDELIVPVGFGDEISLVPGAPLDPQNRYVVLVLF